MRETSTQKGLGNFIPILGWLPNYPRGWLRIDIVAGLSAAAVVIPQAMAYATIAGLPVEVGLYTALVPMLVYAILGTSRPLSVSTTSTIAMLTAVALAGVVNSSNPYDYIVPAATLAIITGVFLVLAGILRLGFIANFISDPVLTGFKAGIGVVIFVGQLGKVLGLSLEKGPILQTLLSIVENLDQINLATTAIAGITLAILIFLPRITKRIPAALVAVAFGILLSAAFDLTSLGVSLVGPIPSGLPSISLPDLSLIFALWPSALGIALMSFVESIAAGRAFTHRGEPGPQSSQELVALGLANIGGGFTQAMPAGGGTSQTAVNDQVGAKSQLAEVVTAGVVAITLLFLAPLISLMPEATLGALVLVAAAGLIKVDEFRKIRAIRTVEFRWAVVAFIGVITLGTLEGIVLAVLISLLVLLYFAEHPPVYILGRKPSTNVFRPLEEHQDDETYPGLLILKSEGLIFFANIQSFLEKVESFVREEQPKIVLLDCSTIPTMEYSAIKQLREFDEKLQDAGITFWMAALTANAFHIHERTPLGQAMGQERLFLDLDAAVNTYLQLEA